ncbi:MAG: hypothetical protein K2Q01_11180 [Rickettsiales bacterium]|nr:hypothetical protein [Rickettsiales bacterium]
MNGFHGTHGDFPQLAMPMPHLLYETLKQRLQALKVGHPDRETSINATLEQMHAAIGESGHSQAASKLKGMPAEHEDAEKPSDPVAHAQVATTIATLLEEGDNLDERVRDALSRALRISQSHSKGYRPGSNGHAAAGGGKK